MHSAARSLPTCASAVPYPRPIYVAALVWGGLFRRESRLRALIPLRD